MKQSTPTHQIHNVQHLLKNYQILKKQENDSQPGFKKSIIRNRRRNKMMELVDEDIKQLLEICPIIKHRHDEAKREGIKTKQT